MGEVGSVEGTLLTLLSLCSLSASWPLSLPQSQVSKYAPITAAVLGQLLRHLWASGRPGALSEAFKLGSCFFEAYRAGELAEALLSDLSFCGELRAWVSAVWMPKRKEFKAVPLLPGRDDMGRDYLLLWGDAAIGKYFSGGAGQGRLSRPHVYADLAPKSSGGSGVSASSSITAVLRRLHEEGADGLGGQETSHDFRGGAAVTAEAAGCSLPDVCYGLGHELEEGGVSGSHSVGRYLRYSGLRAVPLVRGLCGWPVPAGTGRLARPVYASLEGLVGRVWGSGRQLLSTGLLEDMADELFCLSSAATPELARGGRLRPIVQLWLASQVLYYERRS